MSALSPLELERLQALHDIVLPVPPGLWPLAPGYWLVLLLLTLLALRGAQWLWQRWQGNAYRRQALRRLRTLRADTTLSAQSRLTEALRILHAALHALDPAATDWRALLQARLPGAEAMPHAALLADPEPLLTQAPYWPAVRVGPDDARQVLDFVEDWLRQHRGRP